MSLPSSPRYGFKPIWVTLHTAEGARTIGSLFNFFDSNQNASSHAGADGYQLSGDWVPDERAAWTLLNGNPRSLNIEMCGFARWTRAQWLSDGWVDGVWNPRQMIRHAATWARRKCDKHGIPRRLLTPAEVGQGRSGIIDHARYTYGTGDGDHTDVGANFPWDVFFADLNADIRQSQPQPREGDVHFLIKGDESNAVYVASFTSTGQEKRHVDEDEMNSILACGAQLKTLRQYNVDRIPERTPESSLVGRATWDHKVHDDLVADTYIEAHQVLHRIDEHTTPAP